MPDPQISIVIVNYNAGRYLHECVDSIVRAITVPYEVLIVDNRSDDGSLDFLKEAAPELPIRLLKPGNNIGFGAGCNLGAKHAKGAWLHFLNPDTVVNNALDDAYRELRDDREKASIAVTRLTDTTGTVVKSGFVLPTLSNYVLALFRGQLAGRWYRGASVLVSRKAFERLAGWSTYTLAYAEDMDLFFNAQRLGIPVKQLDVQVIHAGEGCTQKFWNAIERRVRVERATRKFYLHNGISRQYYVISALQIIRNLLLLRSDALLQSRAIIRAWKKAE